MKLFRPLHGLVLAGGLSSRMGRDKACLVHPDGRTLARRGHDLLKDAGCEQVMLSLRGDQEIPSGFADLQNLSVIRDPDGSGGGPLVAIMAAMRHRPEADWLVIACDLPRLDLATLRHLVSSKREDEWFLAYRSEFDGLPEPLCAIYTSDASALFQDVGSGSIRTVLKRHECRLLEPITPRSLDNANTPLDWQAATES